MVTAERSPGSGLWPQTLVGRLGTSLVGFILLGMYTGTQEGYSSALFYTLTYVVDGFMEAEIAERSDDQRPSMGQDMRKGRRTEIDLINGFIAAKGDEVGIPTPVSKALVEAVKKVERGEVAASPDNVAHI